MKFKNIYFILSFYCYMLNVLAEVPNMSFKEMATALENIGSTCEPKPTKENIRELLLHVVDAGRETKCFRRCLMEIMDLHVPESGQIREETALEFGGMIYPEKKEQLAAILKTCNSQNAGIDDVCEAAHAHFFCMLEAMRSNGFDIIEIKED